MRRLLFALFLMILGYFSCDNGPKLIKTYFFLGHPYQWGVVDNNRIDYRFKDFDFGQYDQVWLGGDMCARTNETTMTLDYLDSIFDLSAPTTHWTLGNHDVQNGPLHWIEDQTLRPSFYSTYFDGICLMVLNTNEFYHPNYLPKPDECALLKAQLQLLHNIADTITTASHLVLLHHYNLLTNAMTDHQYDLAEVFNFYMEELQVDCTDKQTFEAEIYPVLKKIQQKGVQVIAVSGDLGQRSKAFEYQTKEGVWFLGSGINNSAIDYYIPDYVTDTSPDKVLLFEHMPEERTLSWKFVELNPLLEGENEKGIER